MELLEENKLHIKDEKSPYSMIPYPCDAREEKQVIQLFEEGASNLFSSYFVDISVLFLSMCSSQ